MQTIETLRRRADKLGLRIKKNRSRTPRDYDYGRYAIIMNSCGGTVHPYLVDSIYALTLEDVAYWLDYLEKR